MPSAGGGVLEEQVPAMANPVLPEPQPGRVSSKSVDIVCSQQYKASVSLALLRAGGVFGSGLLHVLGLAYRRYCCC